MCYLLEQLFKGLQDEDGDIVGSGALSHSSYGGIHRRAQTKEAPLSTRLAAPYIVHQTVE